MLLRAVAVFLVVAVAITVALSTGGSADAATGSAASGGGSSLLLQNLFNGIVFGLLLALASVGLSLIYGTTALSNFAHGEMVTFGAMITYFLATPQAVTFPLLPFEFKINMPFLPAVLVGIAIAVFFGWVQDKMIWSQLRRRRVGMVQQMIVSIGLSLALVNFIQWWMGGRPVRLTTSIDPRHQYGPISVGNVTLISMAIAIIALIGVAFFLQRTRLGRATRAVSDNPALASASGIKVDSIIRIVWMMAAGLAALGGILLALYQQGIGFDDGTKLLMMMFAAVTLGGLGHPYGALVGSLIIGIVAEVSTVWLAPDLKFATALFILIIVLLVRPQGILGRAERVG
ncbi:branched-chain amino acid ABC transporter permease [Demequina iriomotensis]|uniref:branched-chain amino acid ABC transporter permease n=1 Tax=Demequina iriomotensis TaxID=1536641 RepID=UPI00078021BF|nr:branched-chain amino acid ABC transporter permease [Demequina iriomotensis]